jgi:hypothetical protein
VVRGLVLVVIAVPGCGRLGFDPTVGASQDASATDDALSTGTDAGEPDAIGSAVVAFTLLPDSSPPPERRSSGAAVAADDRIWIFGGFNSSGPLNEVAAYAPGTGAWETPVPTATPPDRERHALGWDARGDVLAVFGGLAGSFPMFTHHDELFVYSPATNTWTQIPKSGNWPEPRKDAGMVWLPASDQFLLYGGSDGSGSANRFSDLWLLSVDIVGLSATWTEITPNGVAPPAQSAACLAYDPAVRRLIVYGGETQDGVNASTTYQYLVDANAWQLDSSTGSSPGDRAFSGCAWYPGAGRAVLYGGQDNSGSPIAGVYTYDPDSKVWEVPPLDGGSLTPGNRSDLGAAYSSALGGVYMFGGRTATISYSNESWLVELKFQ